MMRFLFVFITSILFSKISFADICGNYSGFEGQEIHMSEIRDELEQSPFMTVCNHPGALQGRPATGLMIRSVVEADSKGRTSRSFLKRVLEKVRTRVQDASGQIEKVKACMGRFRPGCTEVSQWLHTDLPEYVKSARYHLSLSQSQHELKTWTSVASKRVNEDLDSL